MVVDEVDGPTTDRSAGLDCLSGCHWHWSDWITVKGPEGKFRHAPYVMDVLVGRLPSASAVTDLTFEWVVSVSGGSSSYSYP